MSDFEQDVNKPSTARDAADVKSQRQIRKVLRNKLMTQEQAIRAIRAIVATRAEGA